MYHLTYPDYSDHSVNKLLLLSLTHFEVHIGDLIYLQDLRHLSLTSHSVFVGFFCPPLKSKGSTPNVSSTLTPREDTFSFMPNKKFQYETTTRQTTSVTEKFATEQMSVHLSRKTVPVSINSLGNDKRN